MNPRTGFAQLVLAALVGLPLVANADATYTAGVASVAGYFVNQNNTGSSPQSAAGSGSTTQTATFPWNSSAQASANAGTGSLGAYSSASLNLIGWYYGSTIDGSASAYFSFNDIIISGPSATVSTSLNLDINGTLSATSGPLYPSNALPAWAQSYVGFTYGGSFGSGGGSSTVYTAGTAGGSSTTITNAGMFDSTFSGNANLTTALVEVNTGMALSFNAMLQTSAVVGATFGAQPVDLEAISDFSHTLMFSSAPVFNLPDGYTVNSLSGLIVDNHWANPAVTPVPEPEIYAMLGVGLGFMGWVGRRKKLQAV